MRIITRYINRELFLSVLFVLFALVALFTFFDLVGQMDNVGTRYSLWIAVQLTALTLPTRIYEVMPIAVLIGAVYTLSRFASTSEFTILRVSGMSATMLARALLVSGVVLVAATYLFGEFVAPPADKYSRQLKYEATHRDFRVRGFSTGVWVKDVVTDESGKVVSNRFINVRGVRNNVPHGWHIYEADTERNLKSVVTAKTGRFVEGEGWTLDDVRTLTVPKFTAESKEPMTESVQLDRDKSLVWKSSLAGDIFSVLMVKPEAMAIGDLSRYVSHLAVNRQQTSRYEIAFWNKIFYPLAILVMLGLAMPFAYLNVRSGGVSLKIFCGVMMGIGFYALNNMFSFIGVLSAWPPILAAVLPTLVMLALATVSMWYVERR